VDLDRIAGEPIFNEFLRPPYRWLVVHPVSHAQQDVGLVASREEAFGPLARGFSQGTAFPWVGALSTYSRCIALGVQTCTVS
jgi:hypothetical protein